MKLGAGGGAGKGRGLGLGFRRRRKKLGGCRKGRLERRKKERVG